MATNRLFASSAIFFLVITLVAICQAYPEYHRVPIKNVEYHNDDFGNNEEFNYQFRQPRNSDVNDAPDFFEDDEVTGIYGTPQAALVRRAADEANPADWYDETGDNSDSTIELMPGGRVLRSPTHKHEDIEQREVGLGHKSLINQYTSGQNINDQSTILINKNLDAGNNVLYPNQNSGLFSNLGGSSAASSAASSAISSIRGRVDAAASSASSAVSNAASSVNSAADNAAASAASAASSAISSIPSPGTIYGGRQGNILSGSSSSSAASASSSSSSSSTTITIDEQSQVFKDQAIVLFQDLFKEINILRQTISLVFSNLKREFSISPQTVSADEVSASSSSYAAATTELSGLLHRGPKLVELLLNEPHHIWALPDIFTSAVPTHEIVGSLSRTKTTIISLWKVCKEWMALYRITTNVFGGFDLGEALEHHLSAIKLKKFEILNDLVHPSSVTSEDNVNVGSMGKELIHDAILKKLQTFHILVDFVRNIPRIIHNLLVTLKSSFGTVTDGTDLINIGGISSWLPYSLSDGEGSSVTSVSSSSSASSSSTSGASSPIVSTVPIVETLGSSSSSSASSSATGGRQLTTVLPSSSSSLIGGSSSTAASSAGSSGSIVSRPFFSVLNPVQTAGSSSSSSAASSSGSLFSKPFFSNLNPVQTAGSSSSSSTASSSGSLFSKPFFSTLNPVETAGSSSSSSAASSSGSLFSKPFFSTLNPVQTAGSSSSSSAASSSDSLFSKPFFSIPNRAQRVESASSAASSSSDVSQPGTSRYSLLARPQSQHTIKSHHEHKQRLSHEPRDKLSPKRLQYKLPNTLDSGSTSSSSSSSSTSVVSTPLISVPKPAISSGSTASSASSSSSSSGRNIISGSRFSRPNSVGSLGGTASSSSSSSASSSSSIASVPVIAAPIPTQSSVSSTASSSSASSSNVVSTPYVSVNQPTLSGGSSSASSSAASSSSTSGSSGLSRPIISPNSWNNAASAASSASSSSSSSLVSPGPTIYSTLAPSGSVKSALSSSSSSSSASSSSGSSGNYNGYDINIHEREFPHITNVYQPRSGVSAVAPSTALVSGRGGSQIVGGSGGHLQTRNFPSFPLTLPRSKLCQVIGVNRINPGDIVTIKLPNNAVLMGECQDYVNPIGFRFLHSIPKHRANINVWNIGSNDFHDSECVEAFDRLLRSRY